MMMNENGRIDEAYDKLLNSGIKLADEDIEDIASIVEQYTNDSIIEEAKELAAMSELKDQSAVVSLTYDPVTGNPIVADDIDLEDESIPSLDDIMLSDEDLYLTEMDFAKEIARCAICEFFAIENSPEALEANGVTDEVLDVVNDIVEKYKTYTRINKKFSYYNAMPDPIKVLIDKFQGANALKMVGNMNREARNYITGCFINAVMECTIGDVMQADINQLIKKESAKEAEEMKKDGEWREQRDFFTKKLPEEIMKCEEEGNTQIADNFRKMIESYNQSYQYTALKDAIQHGLKVRHIDLEDFSKYCNSFDNRMENHKFGEFVFNVSSITFTYNALLRYTNTFKNINEEVCKKVIAYFIAYCDKYKPNLGELSEFVYAYYFMHNIFTLEYYDPDNEEDVAFYNERVQYLQELIDVVNERESK